MKVVCIKNSSQYNIFQVTLGKIYDATTSNPSDKDLGGPYYHITNDLGNADVFPSGYFEPVEIHRDNKLNKLIDV